MSFAHFDCSLYIVPEEEQYLDFGFSIGLND